MGFEEFVMDDMVSIGPIIFPKDSADAALWRKNLYMMVLIGAIQIFAPLLMVFNEWNRAQIVDVFLNPTWRQIFCLGNNWQESLTTLMGSAVCLIHLTIIREQVEDEMANAQKTEHLPFDPIFLLIGDLVNLWCLLITIILTPLLYWKSDASGIVLGSLSLLFIHTLDDIGSRALMYLELNDTEFQRNVMHTYALLSHCPVRLQDVVDSTAKTADDIWKIRFSASGKLLFTGTDDTAGTDTSFTQASAVPGIQACECRIMLDPMAMRTEDSITTLTHLEKLRTIYKVSASGRAVKLPRRNFAKLLTIFVWFAFLSQIIFPIAFLIGNNPC